MKINKMETIARCGEKQFHQENVKIHSKEGQEISITSDSMHFGLWIIHFKNEENKTMKDDIIKDYGEGIPEQELFDIIKEGLDNIKEKKNELYADISILDTPKGNLLKSAILAGMSMGFSQRATGNIDSNGRITDYKVFTWDAVQMPKNENRRRKLNKILKRINDEK